MGRESFQAPARGDRTVRDLSDSASLGLRSCSSRLLATPSRSRVFEGPKVGMRRRGLQGVRRSHEGGAPATRSVTSCRRPQGAPLPSATGDTVRGAVRRGGPSPGSRSAGARSWGSLPFASRPSAVLRCGSRSRRGWDEVLSVRARRALGSRGPSLGMGIVSRVTWGQHWSGLAGALLFPTVAAL